VRILQADISKEERQALEVSSEVLRSAVTPIADMRVHMFERGPGTKIGNKGRDGWSFIT
jgi:hypothetical protein